MGADDPDARRLAKVIDHPIRARIIELLGERGPLGWKELSSEIGVKTGALYHHLDTLEGLVGRDPSKKYFLTDRGRIVFSRTSQSRSFESVKKAAADLRRSGASRRRGLAIFIPRTLLSSATSTRSASLVALASLVAVFGALSLFLGASPTLYFVRPDPGALPTLGGFGASLLVIIGLGYASSRLVLKSSVDLPALSAAAALSFLPVVAASSVTLLPQASSLFASSGAVFTLFLVFAQTWSSSILGAGISVATGVRIERTLLVSLAVLYATMVVMLLQGPRV